MMTALPMETQRNVEHINSDLNRITNHNQGEEIPLSCVRQRTSAVRESAQFATAQCPSERWHHSAHILAVSETASSLPGDPVLASLRATRSGTHRSPRGHPVASPDSLRIPSVQCHSRSGHTRGDGFTTAPPAVQFLRRNSSKLADGLCTLTKGSVRLNHKGGKVHVSSPRSDFSTILGFLLLLSLPRSTEALLRVSHVRVAGRGSDSHVKPERVI